MAAALVTYSDAHTQRRRPWAKRSGATVVGQAFGTSMAQEARTGSGPVPVTGRIGGCIGFSPSH